MKHFLGRIVQVLTRILRLLQVAHPFDFPGTPTILRLDLGNPVGFDLFVVVFAVVSLIEV